MQSKLIITIIVLLLVGGATYYFTREATAPGMDNPPTPPQTQEDPAVEAFQSELEAGVVAQFGQPIEGFMPDGLLRAFPGLTERDFDGVDASIGHFEYADGELVHDLEGEDEIHTAAEALTAEGYATLFANISARLGVETTEDSIGEIMAAISEDVEEPAPPPASDDESVACTMDAKECPDGSYVGRVPPTCEFAECPGESPSDNGNEFIECEPDQRLADFCTEQYAPVCAQVLPAGEDAPRADASFETYSNSCFACMDEQVRGYTEGACEAE